MMMPHCITHLVVLQNNEKSVPSIHKSVVNISTPPSPFTLVVTSQAECRLFSTSRGERRGALGGLSDDSLSWPEQGGTGIWGEGSSLIGGVGTGPKRRLFLHHARPLGKRTWYCRDLPWPITTPTLSHQSVVASWILTCWPKMSLKRGRAWLSYRLVTWSVWAAARRLYSSVLVCHSSVNDGGWAGTQVRRGWP